MLAKLCKNFYDIKHKALKHMGKNYFKERELYTEVVSLANRVRAKHQSIALVKYTQL